MKYIISILGILIFLGFKNADFLKKGKLVIHTNLFRGNHNDFAKSCVEVLNGEYAFVGFTEEKVKNKIKKDALLYVSYLERKGRKTSFERKYIKSFGGKGNDEFHVVQKTIDGNLIVAGYTEGFKDKIPKKNAKDGWLMKVNEQGIILWDTIFVKNVGGDDELFDVIQLEDRNFVAVGEKNGAAWVLKFDNNGEIIRDTTFKHPNSRNKLRKYSARAIVEDRLTRNLGITGAKTNDRLGGGFFLELDRDIHPVVELEEFPAPKQIPIIKSGKDIVFKDSSYYILGDHFIDNSKNADVNIRLIHQDSILKWKPYYDFEGDFPDTSSCLSLTQKGGFIISGHSKSYPRSYEESFNPIIIHKDDIDGVKFYGKDLKDTYGDYIFGHAATSDDGLLLAGATMPSVGRLREWDAWFLKLNFAEDDCSFQEFEKLTIDTIYIEDQMNLDTIEAGESGFITFKITNKGSKKACGLSAQILLDSTINGLIPYENIALPSIPIGTNKYREFRIPIKGDKDLFTDKTKLKVILTKENLPNRFCESPTIDIVTKARPVPLLKIVNFNFQPISKLTEQQTKRGDTIQVEINVKNFGEGTAAKVDAVINFPYQVEGIENQNLSLSNLQPGEIRPFKAKFKANAFFIRDSIPINCVVFDDKRSTVDFAFLKFGIRSYFDIDFPDTTFTPSRIPNWIGKHKRGPNGMDLYYENISPKLKVEWAYDNRVGDLDNMKNKNGFPLKMINIPLKVRIYSNEKIDTSTILAKHWNQKKEITIPYKKIYETGRNNGYENSYVVFFEVIFRKGKNKIFMEVGGQTFDGEEIYFDYTPPDLSIVILGVPYKDKEFKTGENAYSIYKKIKELEQSNLYSKIIPWVIDTSRVGTDLKGINNLIKHRLTGSIPNDNHIMYYSCSHGLIGNGKEDFFIIPSYSYKDRDKKKSFNKKLAFRNISDLLTSKNCQQVYMLMDACQSRKAADIARLREKAKNKNENKLLPPRMRIEEIKEKNFQELEFASPAGLHFIASSEKLSYSPENELTFFTDAILMGMNDMVARDNIYNRRRDVTVKKTQNQFVTCFDFFEYVKIVVRDSSKKNKKNQIPFFAKKGFKDLTIFWEYH